MPAALQTLRLMLRALALFAGTLLLLLVAVTRSTLPAEYQLAHGLSLLGAVAGCGGAVTVAARNGAVIRVRALVGVGWITAALLPAIGATVAEPSPESLGSGLGIGIVLGLLASLGIALVAFGARPAWFRSTRASHAAT